MKTHVSQNVAFSSCARPLRANQLRLHPVASVLMTTTAVSAIFVFGANRSHATWLIASPPPEPVEVRVFAEPGAQLYSRFDPRFKVITPQVYGACNGGVNPTTFKDGWVNVGGLGGDGVTVGLPINPGPLSQGPVHYGSANAPLRPALRVDLMAHMQLPPGTPTDGNGAGGPQRTGGLLAPVAACNAHLAKMGVDARRAAARQGFTVNVPQAIRGSARLDCTTNFALQYFTVPVAVKCEPAPPVINRVSLRVEWSQQEACPSEVRLIGVIDGNFNHTGKRIFMGNQYLGGYEPYQIGSGQMTVVETRKLNWAAHTQGTLAPAPGSDATMDGWAQLNVQPNSELPGAPALFTSERVSYRVTCKREPAQRALPATSPPSRARAEPPKR
jgi:hypothetical protein